MIFGTPFSVRKFNRYAREGGDDGVLCEPGYFLAAYSTGRNEPLPVSYMGLPVKRIVDGAGEPVGVWCAPFRRQHTWDVVVGATYSELKESVRTYKGMSF